MSQSKMNKLMPSESIPLPSLIKEKILTTSDSMKQMKSKFMNADINDFHVKVDNHLFLHFYNEPELQVSARKECKICIFVRNHECPHEYFDKRKVLFTSYYAFLEQQLKGHSLKKIKKNREYFCSLLLSCVSSPVVTKRERYEDIVKFLKKYATESFSSKKKFWKKYLLHSEITTIVPERVVEHIFNVCAQSDQNVANQCRSDVFDDIVEHLNGVSAEALFGVNLEIPQNTMAQLFKLIGHCQQAVIDSCKTIFNITKELVLFFVIYYICFTLVIRALTSKWTCKILLQIISLVLVYYFHNIIEKNNPLGQLQDWIMSKLKSSSNVIVAQSASFSEFIGILPVLFLTTLKIPVKFATCMVQSKFLDALMRKLSYLGDTKMYSGIDKIGSHFISMVTDIQTYVCEYFGYDCTIPISKEEDPSVKFMKSVQDIELEYSNKTIVYSIATRTRIVGLYQEGCKLARAQVYRSVQLEILQACKNLLKLLEKFNSKLNMNGSIRDPPVTVLLHGDTGAGKSSLTIPLSLEILKRIYIKQKNTFLLNQLKENWQSQIYARAAEQEFWDNYHGQTICIWDDWNQQVDSANNPSIELFELIRASNIFPFPLHMANLEEKSNTYFTSEVLICSSNNKLPKTESLNFPKALLRRFNIAITVTRKDMKKKNFDTTNYSFSVYDPDDVSKTEETLSWDELVTKLVDTYESSKGFVSSINTFISENILNFSSDEVVAQMETPNYAEEMFDQRPYFNFYSKFLKLNIQENALAWRDKFAWILDLPWLKICTGILALLGVGYGLYSYLQREEKPIKSEANDQFLKRYVAKRKEAVEAFDSEAYEPVVTQKKVTTIPKTEIYNVTTPTKQVTGLNMKVVELNKIQSEAIADLSSFEMANSVASKNLYRINIVRLMEDGTYNTERLGHGLFLRGRVCIMPAHYCLRLGNCSNTDYLSFDSIRLKRVFKVLVKDLKFSQFAKDGLTIDLCSVLIPTATVHSDILSKFTTESALSSTGSTQACIMTLRYFGDDVILDRRTGMTESTIAYVDKPISYTSDQQTKYCARTAWKYTHMQTASGDCGAPLFVQNSIVAPGKICGIHIAGGNGEGFALALNKNDVEAISNLYPAEFKQIVTTSIAQMDINPYKNQELLVHGMLDAPIVQPSKTKLQHSPLYNEITESKKRPALLRPTIIDGSLWDPLEYRIMRMGKESVVLPLDVISAASEAVLREFKSVYVRYQDKLKGRFTCPLTFEETVLGIDGEEFVNSVKRNTSCGFPFTQNKLTRVDFFGVDETYDLSSENLAYLKKLVEIYEDGARKRIVFDHVHVSTLKDELKELLKYHKTRMFAAGPIDYLVWTKKWFNGVVAILGELRNDIHISVGTNPYSMDWDNIAKLMTRKQNNIIAGDFEGFDASEQLYLLQTACKILIDFSQFVFGVDDEARIQMEAICIGLYNSFHASGQMLIQWVKSLPSGHYLTAIVNSIFVVLVMCSAFIKTTRREEEPLSVRARYFFKECDIVAYGDDHLLSIPDKYIDKLNQQTLVEVLKEFGLSYTDERKTNNVETKTRPITEVTYLKREFYYDENLGRWTGPLDINTILETPMWVKKTPDVPLQTLARVDSSLRELALHPKEMWDKYFPIFHDNCKKFLNLLPENDNYEDVRYDVLYNEDSSNQCDLAIL